MERVDDILVKSQKDAEALSERLGIPLEELRDKAVAAMRALITVGKSFEKPVIITFTENGEITEIKKV